MDTTHEHYQALKRIAGRSRLVSRPQIHQELRLSPHDCQSIVAELVRLGLLRQTTSDRGQTYYWLAGDALPLLDS